MSDKSKFSQIETVESDGMIFASVLDLSIWLRDMGNDEEFTDAHREVFLFLVNQLTRLVVK